MHANVAPTTPLLTESLIEIVKNTYQRKLRWLTVEKPTKAIFRIHNFTSDTPPVKASISETSS